MWLISLLELRDVLLRKLNAQRLYRIIDMMLLRGTNDGSSHAWPLQYPREGYLRRRYTVLVCHSARGRCDG